MEMKLDIEKVLEIYKQRVANLEHEIVLLTAQLQQLRESNNNNNK